MYTWAGFNQMYLFTALSVSATVGLRHTLIFSSQLLLLNTRGLCLGILYLIFTAVQTMAVKALTHGGDY